MMQLSKEKLIDFWRSRHQFLSSKENQWIQNRFNFISNLFREMLDVKVGYNIGEDRTFINGKELLFRDGSSPSLDYFGCMDDGMPAGGALNGVRNMVDRFPEEYSDIIWRIAYMLGGFDDCEPHEMTEDFRIISNIITGPNDNGSLVSEGRMRHPSSNLADNNYFFKVISTVQQISKDELEDVITGGDLVLRYPHDSYYGNETDQDTRRKMQLETLNHRFPYKYLYMWSHANNMLHPIGLSAYKKIIANPDPFTYIEDLNMDEPLKDFAVHWKDYSQRIQDIIPYDLRGDNFWDEMSRLLSIIVLQDQDIRNIRVMAETNKAVILYGQPGTGKTYQAKLLATNLLNLESPDKLSNELFDVKTKKGHYCLVQFHPNYTYEDFHSCPLK